MNFGFIQFSFLKKKKKEDVQKQYDCNKGYGTLYKSVVAGILLGILGTGYMKLVMAAEGGAGAPSSATWSNQITTGLASFYDTTVYSQIGFDSATGKLYLYSSYGYYTAITIPALKGYSAATSSDLGLVKVGSNITNSSGTISLTKANVTSALGYTPPTADTDTHWTSHMYVGSGSAANAATTNGNTKIALADNSTVRNILTIKGTGASSVTSDANGVITINSTDNNTTYSAATQSANGLMSAADKKKLDGIATSANAYTLPAATSSALGGVKVGSNITNSSGTISLTKANVTAALGYTPPTTDTNTTYSAATSSTLGLVKTGSNITNSSGTISLTKDNVTAALGYTPPTTDTNTTYAAMSADELTAGTATTSRALTAKVLGDYVKGKTNDKISGLSVNGKTITYTKGDGTIGTITTQDTTYSAGSGLNLSGTTLSVNTNGTATAGNTGVVSGGTLYNAVKDTIKYDGDDKSKISLGGSRGTVLSNLLGTTITADSTNAVTGAQLYSVQQSIDGFAEDISKHNESIRALNTSVTSALSSVAASGLLVDTIDASKADASLANLSESGKQVLRTYAVNAVQEYMASQNAPPTVPMAVSSPVSTNGNILTVTNAGNGSLHVGEGSYVNGTSSIAIGVGNQVNANNSGAFGDPSIINADESYVLGNDDTINTGATGSFIVGNDGVSDAKGGLIFGSQSKALSTAEDGMALGNRTEVFAKGAIAIGSDSIADEENAVSIGNSNLKRKIVNVADGDISQNSGYAVTGAQLFVTNENVQKNTEALEKKADVDAGNISVSDWSAKLGIGKVEADDSHLVTGGTVYTALQDIKNDTLVKLNGDAITIGADSDVSTIDVSDKSGNTRVIRGVYTDAEDATSVANVGYVTQMGETIVNSTNRALRSLDTRVNKAGANAAALASLPTPAFDGDEKWAFAAGIGHYRGENAASVGAFYRPQDNVMLRVGGSFGNGDEMVGAGVAVTLNKGNTHVVSKAQLVRTINAQANEIQMIKQENADMKAEHRAEINALKKNYESEIAELKAAVADLATKVK